MQSIYVARVAVARPHRLPALTSTVNRFGQDAADEGIGFEILFNPGLVQVESVDTDTGNELDELPEPWLRRWLPHLLGAPHRGFVGKEHVSVDLLPERHHAPGQN